MKLSDNAQTPSERGGNKAINKNQRVGDKASAPSHPTWPIFNSLYSNKGKPNPTVESFIQSEYGSNPSFINTICYHLYFELSYNFSIR